MLFLLYDNSTAFTIYKIVRPVVRDFLRDLIILEGFVTRHPEDELVKAFLNPKTELLVLDDNGDSFYSRSSEADSADQLACAKVQPGDVHGEMRVMQYLKHAQSLVAYIAVSMLCCGVCHQALDGVDKGSIAHYPGYHGKVFTFGLSDWMKHNIRFIEEFLGKEAYEAFAKVKDNKITLKTGNEVYAGQLSLLLIELMPKLLTELQDYVKIPQGIKDAPLAADKGFLIDFGIVDPSTHLVSKYYSCRARDLVGEPDGAGFTAQLIGDNTGNK